MRRFQLVRDNDVSGVSGTGVVAQGVQFEDGSCVMHWKGHLSSKVIFDSADKLLKVHGHDGSSWLDWIDPESDLLPLD